MLHLFPENPFPFLILFVPFSLYRAVSFAYPAGPQNVANSAIPHVLNIGGPASNPLPITPSVGDVVTHLLQWQRAQQDVRYRHAVLREISLTVDDWDRPGDITFSTNIQDFRRIQWEFTYEGPTLSPDELTVLVFTNQWPQHWDRRDLSPQIGTGHPQDFNFLSPIVNFEQTSRRMGVEWADQVLKAHGLRGRYVRVILVQAGPRPLGWCFAHLEVAPGQFRCRLVTIATGFIMDVSDCWHII